MNSGKFEDLKQDFLQSIYEGFAVAQEVLNLGKL